MTATKPVILLAFANEPVDSINYLRKLSVERHAVHTALENAKAAGLCDFELLYDATLDDILAAFRNPSLHGRIAVFHYGGHADSYELLFQSDSGNLERIDGRGFAAILAEQPSMQLVFLNACSTEPQVESLLAANVQVVIATSQEVDDEVASSLAGQFYEELAHGAAIGSAYRQAVAALRARRGDDPTLFYARGAAPVIEKEVPATGTDSVGIAGSATGGYWPWMLRTRPGAETAMESSLPLATGDPLFGLPSLPPKALPDSPYHAASTTTPGDMAELFFGRGREIRSLYQRRHGDGSLQRDPLLWPVRRRQIVFARRRPRPTPGKCSRCRIRPPRPQPRPVGHAAQAIGRAPGGSKRTADACPVLAGSRASDRQAARSDS